jgi:hypothetical protein
VSVISSACSLAVRLRHQQVLELHAQPPRVLGVERVLGVDERAHAAGLLRLGDRVQGQRRLAARLRPEDLDDAPARQPAGPQRHVERDRPRRDHVHLARLGPVEPHQRPRPELLVDRLDRLGDRLLLLLL